MAPSLSLVPVDHENAEAALKVASKVVKVVTLPPPEFQHSKSSLRGSSDTSSLSPKDSVDLEHAHMFPDGQSGGCVVH